MARPSNRCSRQKFFELGEPMDKERTIVRLRTASGAPVAIEIGERYGAPAGKALEFDARRIAEFVSALVGEFKMVTSVATVKALKVDFALDAEQDGETLVIFVSREP